MSDACALWAALCDRQALGEALHERDRAFLTTHRLGCGACAAEAGVWGTLGTLLDQASEAHAHEVPAQPHLIVALPALAAASHRHPWPYARIVGGAAILLFVAALLGMVYLSAAPASTLDEAAKQLGPISGGD